MIEVKTNKEDYYQILERTWLKNVPLMFRLIVSGFILVISLNICKNKGWEPTVMIIPSIIMIGVLLSPRLIAKYQANKNFMYNGYSVPPSTYYRVDEKGIELRTCEGSEYFSREDILSTIEYKDLILINLRELYFGVIPKRYLNDQSTMLMKSYVESSKSCSNKEKSSKSKLRKYIFRSIVLAIFVWKLARIIMT